MRKMVFLALVVNLFTQIYAEARERRFYKCDIHNGSQSVTACIAESILVPGPIKVLHPQRYPDTYIQPPMDYIYHRWDRDPDGSFHQRTSGFNVAPTIQNQALYNYLSENAVWTFRDKFASNYYTDGHYCMNYTFTIDDSTFPPHLQSAESKVEAIAAGSISPEKAASAAEARASGDPQIVAGQAAADAQAAAAKHAAFVQGATDAQTIVAREPLNTWAILERDLMSKAADDAQLELNQANANAQSARLDAQEDAMQKMQEAHAQEVDSLKAVIRALCARMGVPAPEDF